MQRIFIFRAASILVFVIARSGIGALPSPVIDQNTGQTQSGIFNAGIVGFSWEQGVTAGISGRLVGVDILPQSADPTGPPTATTKFFVNVGPPWQSDTNDFQQVITFPSHSPVNWFYVDVSSANIFLTAGQKFVWGVTGVSGADVGNPWLFGHHQLDYSRGELWQSTATNLSTGKLFVIVGDTSDLAFRTYMIPVPEPSCAWLSSLACLVGCTHHRRIK
jgi:hypothetical protein